MLGVLRERWVAAQPLKEGPWEEEGSCRSCGVFTARVLAFLVQVNLSLVVLLLLDGSRMTWRAMHFMLKINQSRAGLLGKNCRTVTF